MEKLSNNGLIVFVKNPKQGEVKTRLAASIGDKEALDVHLKLVEYTRSVTRFVEAQPHVFYSNYIQDDDEWVPTDYEKHLQHGDDLGQCMRNAFEKLFDLGYEKLIIIGSDCPELTSDVVNDAFRQLDNCDVVIGPSRDGGYYLLGMKELIPELFENKDWGSETVFDQTLQDLQNRKLIWHEMPIFRDVDTEDDLYKMRGLYVRSGEQADH